MDVEFKVVGKPFVSKAPTERSYKLIDYSPTKIVFRIMNKTRDIPYCDTFAVEEEWYIATPTPNAKCCIVRVSYACYFYKFSMMKSIIKSGAESDTTLVLNEFKKHLSSKGLDFVEKKKPAPLAAKPAQPADG